MSDPEIPLLTQLRAEFYAAAAVDTAKPARRARRRWRRPRGRTAFAAVAVGLVIAGCAVAASGLLSSSERLALSTVDCYFSDGVHIPGASGFDSNITGAPLSAGQTPAQLCQQQFNENRSALLSDGVLPMKNAPVLSCKASATSTVVFVGSGSAFIGARTAFIGSGSVGGCQQLGLAALPSNFAAASRSVRLLVAQLQKTSDSRNCWPPNALLQATRSMLTKNGLPGWTVTLPNPSQHAGPFELGTCASFQAIDGADRTVQLGLGLSRSLAALNTRIDDQLAADLNQHCYSRASARALIDDALASSGLSPRIAITTNPDGGPGFSWGTKAEARHWAANCPILFETWPTSQTHTVLVWLTAHNGTYIDPFSGRPPALAEFHSS